MEFCSSRGLPADTQFQLNLVLEELFVNAIRHGGCAGLKDAACIRLDCTAENAVHLEFRDRGPAFDLTAAPAADVGAPLSERQAGGLGIHLVRQIMRDVAYRREGEWNILTMLHPVAEEQETT